MNRLARNFLIVAVAIAATAAGYLVSHSHNSSAATAAKQLLALTLPDSNGNTQSLGQWQGKLLVINFWATWCPPCREEMPGFSRLQRKLSGSSVQFLGIGIDSAAKIREFASQTPVSYPLLVGTPGLMEIVSQLGNSAGGLPYTVILGKDGVLQNTRLGAWQESDLENILVGMIR